MFYNVQQNPQRCSQFVFMLLRERAAGVSPQTENGRAAARRPGEESGVSAALKRDREMPRHNSGGTAESFRPGLLGAFYFYRKGYANDGLDES